MTEFQKLDLTFGIMDVGTSVEFFNKMDKCKWHGQIKPCKECAKDLDKVSNELNNLFSRITISFGKDGNPVVIKKQPRQKSLN